ncbi:MAG: toll/interleukin-1 receptor domain-containing protein [Planctomycetota bacterium]
MKRTGKALLDFIKDLLPNLAASGLWDSLTPHAAALAGAAGVTLVGAGLIPTGAALACVATYVGLHRITRKSEKQEAGDLKAALEILRRGSENTEQELKNLGFQLKMNFENVHLQVTQLDRAVADVAELLTAGFDGLDARLEQHFRQNRENLDDVWFDLRLHFEEVKEQLHRIAGDARTAAELARENRHLLAAYGFVPLVASNVPPVPGTFVERPAPFAKLVETLWTDERASLVGRAQAAAGGGYGKTVLAYHYAARYRDRYPGGTYKAACEGVTIAQALDQLMPPHEGVKGLSMEERARIVRAKLSGESRALLILDNMDSAAQWRQYRGSGLLPTFPCHVLITTRADDIHDLPAVPVDKLEEAEAVELLANYRPSARHSDHADAIFAILRETERVAALVAAVGMAMAEDRSDDWAGYAAWLPSATKGTSAMHIGLMSSDHVPQTPEQLEQPILQALYALRFTGATYAVGPWKGTFRLEFVPAPILRAWIRVLPVELCSAVDRLQSLGYVETHAGSVALPFGERTVQSAPHARQVTTELIIERPEGGHVAISHVLEKGRETTIALGGVYRDGKFRIHDPGALAFTLSPRGHVARYCLTARGLERAEELRARQASANMKNDAEEPRAAARPPAVFICYCKKDYQQATDLYDYLVAAGANPWLDRKDLVLGDNWEDEIKKAVTTADVFVVCLRSGFDEIGFRQKEVRWAKEALKLRPPGRGFIVPFMLEACGLPEWCKPLHAGADLSKPTHMAEVARAIEKHCGTALKRSYVE